MMILGKNREPNTNTASYYKSRLVLGDYAYIPILKNAHRLTSAIMVNHGFIKNNDVDLSDKIKIVTLRDPISRWFAGVSQFLYLHSPNIIIDENTVELLTKIVVLDGHSSAQANYLSGIDTSECIFFNMDEPNYQQNFQRFCLTNFNNANYLGANNQEIIRLDHFSTMAPIYKDIKSKLETYCTDQYRNRLIKYYKEDIELYNTVKFYRGET
jgi:hypothetical protein